ncbi:hypothetical protein BHE74_00009586 [Ensete ventricosum]|nr:hypothetical protein GW17_00020992 [Ensete ventricosum]RWW81982.1 hypothetical protein BHE74_00009586 [Ensete ventricosum]
MGFHRKRTCAEMGTTCRSEIGKQVASIDPISPLTQITHHVARSHAVQGSGPRPTLLTTQPHCFQLLSTEYFLCPPHRVIWKPTTTVLGSGSKCSKTLRWPTRIGRTPQSGAPNRGHRMIRSDGCDDAPYRLHPKSGSRPRKVS